MNETLSNRGTATSTLPGYGLLATKLRVPPQRPGAVPRERLNQLLDEGTRGKLTILCAPAGFGKTTALGEWSGRSEKPVAWISLDGGDNDPAVFLAYLVAALRRLLPGVGEDAMSLLRSLGSVPVEAILTSLLNEIDPFREDFVVVLDDYHLLQTDTVHHAVAFLLEHVPPCMHLIVAGRAEPPLPLARLLAEAQLTRLSAADLRFTPEEGAAFLDKTMDLDLSAGEVEMLHASTEGWAAGLQLAALSVRETEGVPELARNLTWANRYVLDYLAEEVLDRQTEDVRDFLLRTSVVGRLCGPLCDVVTGRGDGQEMLETLERSNLFLAPLDDERRWFRYHHLFSDFLFKNLLRMRPGSVAGLHCRACDWFEREGFTAEAVSHALASGDKERAANMVERIARTTLRRGELSTLRGWLGSLPDDLVCARPRLCTFFAWYYLAIGRLEDIEPYLGKAERALDASGRPAPAGGAPGDAAGPEADRRELLGEAAAIRAAVAGLRGESSRAIELAHRATGLLTENNSFLRAIIAASRGFAHRSDGNVAAASREFVEAAAISSSAGSAYVALLAYKNLAELRLVQGRLQAAADVCRRALELAAERVGRLPASSAAHVGMGEVLYERNNLGAATHHLEEGIELAERGGNVEIVLDGHVVLSRAQQALGDRVGAANTLLRARRLAHRHGMVGWVDRVEAWQARLSLACNDLGSAVRWAEEFELRHGDELPTRSRELELATLARVLLARGRAEEALELLGRLLADAEAGGRGGQAIELLVLEALTLAARDDMDEALLPLGRALALAEPEGYVRVFTDEGAPVAALLERLSRVRRPGGGASRSYVDGLLMALGRDRAPRRRGRNGQQGTGGLLVEPLSERELEVLGLLASGATNREIAGRLYVSPDTVKTHLKHVYSKLEAHSRTQAVARARELGLM